VPVREEDFAARLINGDTLGAIVRVFFAMRCSSSSSSIHVYMFILPYSTLHPRLLVDFKSPPIPPTLSLDLRIIVRRGLSFVSMDNSLKLQKRFDEHDDERSVGSSRPSNFGFKSKYRILFKFDCILCAPNRIFIDQKMEHLESINER